MTPEQALLIALYDASSKLLEAYNAAGMLGRGDLAPHIREAQQLVVRALAAVAVDRTEVTS